MNPALQPTWLVLGGSSAVARAFASEAAAHGANLLLAGRDQDDLERQAADLRIRHGVQAIPLLFDARDFGTHADLIRICDRLADGPLNVLLAFGIMPSQREADCDPFLAAAEVEVNFTGAASVLAALAPVLKRRRGGTVVALGSVAGDRGRPRNYLYGATKAALHTYLQGYAAELSRASVRVLCLKAGVVDTAMTWPLPGLPFMVPPQAFAASAWRLAERRSGSTYLPRIWWPVMVLIRAMPVWIFNYMNF